MGRKCQLTGEKKPITPLPFPTPDRRTKKLQEANLQFKRVWWPPGESLGQVAVIHKSHQDLAEKRSHPAYAKEAGINLNHC